MAGEDFGLLSGIAQGLNQGVQAYQEEKRNRWNRNLQQGLLQEHGMNIDPNTGEVSMLPWKREQVANEQQKYSADSPLSIRGRAARKAIYDKYNPELSKALDGMSEAEMQEHDKGLAAKYMTGEQGLLGKQQMTSMMGQRLDLQGQRMTNQVNQNANAAVQNDKTLTPYIQRADGAKKVLNLIQAGRRGEFATNKALLGQLNAEIARLETGSQSPGLGQSEKTEMESASANLRALYDKATSGVSAVDLEPQFKQAEGMVKDLGKSYAAQIDSRMQTIKSGQLPQAQSVIDQKHKQLLEPYAKTFGYNPSYSGGEKESPDQGKVSSNVLNAAKSLPIGTRRKDPSGVERIKTANGWVEAGNGG